MRFAGPLAALLAAAVRAVGIDRDVHVVTAVPSHRRRLRERGFDAAQLLASRVCRRLDLPPARSLLRRYGAAAPRARGAPRGRPPFRLRRCARRLVAGRTVLLVDDVLTSGATVRACARLLADAGAAEVRVAILARTPLRSGRMDLATHPG